jgi:DNA-binding winged helix-turn-helix (wHTH) protein
MGGRSSTRAHGAFEFSGFRLDRKAGQLRRGATAIRLRPKTWEVLCHLADRPGVLVTKRELLDAVWGDVAVTEDTLTQSILDLRRAFGDDARKPRFVETVHGRGFRFLPAPPEVGRPPAGRSRNAVGATPFIGRGPELTRLRMALRRAARGQRQIVFVTGEAGIGKTRLMEELLRSPVVRSMDVLVLSGRCIERHAGREAYAPLLEALERALVSPDDETLRASFARLAPSWIAQMPALADDGVRAAPDEALVAGPPARMLREGVAGLEAMASARAVVLVLEDLHWSDHATIDLISALGERSDPARLLLIVSYRPAEASVAEHPIRLVRRTLRVHGRSVDVALDYLSESSVREYLRLRLGNGALKLAPLIHDHTDGNPLFVVQVVDELIRRGTITRTQRAWSVASGITRRDLALSEDLREMIALDLRHLTPDERQIVETGAVAGVAFAPEIVAAALDREPEEVGAACDRLARARLLLDAVAQPRSPVGRVVSQHRFIHDLHHEVVYGQVSAARRGRLHARLGDALERAGAADAPDLAPELARHFERAGDRQRAVPYLVVSATRALRRYAGLEAVSYLEEALALLARDGDRDQEIAVRSLLSLALSTTRGYLSDEVVRNYERVMQLQRAAPDSRHGFETAYALFLVVFHRADRDATERVVAEIERMVIALGATELEPRVAMARGLLELYSGRLENADQAFARVAGPASEAASDFGSVYGMDAIVHALGHGGICDWLRGYPARAQAKTREGIVHAERGDNPMTLGVALCHAAYVAAICGEAGQADALSERAERVAAERDIGLYQPIAAFARGMALAERGRFAEALPLVKEGVAGRQAMGSRLAGSMLLAALADVQLRAKRYEEGLARVEEGLADANTSVGASHVAELWRLRGELLLGRSVGSQGRRRPSWAANATEAEACFRRGLGIAKRQGARMLALKAASSLVRLDAAQRREGGERATLASLYASFDEGLDTTDLVEARRLLGRVDAAPQVAS